jgi:hypothetical protein
MRSNQNLDQAKHYFSKGLKVAREQKAKSLELRLRLSIYDLYAPTENADEHRSELSEIYGSFSEGFATADLVKAKTAFVRTSGSTDSRSRSSSLTS